MKKVKKIVLSICCIATAAVVFFANKERTMLSEVISSNVEALVSGDNNYPGYDKNNLYMSYDKGDMDGYCGEITTGNPNFTLCSNWLKTKKELLHDVCYTKKKSE